MGPEEPHQFAKHQQPNEQQGNSPDTDLFARAEQNPPAGHSGRHRLRLYAAGSSGTGVCLSRLPAAFLRNAVTPVDKRYFDYEAFNGNGIGWGIDTVLATMLHHMYFWGTERLALPPEKAKKGQYDQANAFERLRALLSLPRHVGISGRQFPTGTDALPSTPFGTVRYRRHGISAVKRSASVY